MSTDYITTKQIPKQQFLAAVEKCGYKEDINKDTTQDSVCITDGVNYVWFYLAEGQVVAATKYAANSVQSILDSLSAELGTKFISEHDDDYLKEEEDMPVRLKLCKAPDEEE